MDIGSLAAYVEYSRNCTWPVEALGWLVNSISSAVASRKKIRKIFEQKSSIVEKAEPVVLDCVKGNIEFSNVSFDIGTTNILSDINFSVEQGKTLGIMGATGSGKSSVINLLERFYDTTEGTVKIDGVDVKGSFTFTDKGKYFGSNAGCIFVLRFHKRKHQDGKT